MIKIAHISDIHFKPIQRHDEYRKAFELLFEELKEIKPDIIINTGDFYHTKTSLISPEVIEIMSWAFTGLANITTTYSILGNHDLSMSNLSRKNIIKTIHELLNNKNLILLEKSITKTIKIKNKNVSLHPFSMIDKKGWVNLKPIEGNINIALFHGSVSNSKTDTGWVLKDYDLNMDTFKEFDFIFLGDIHKHQTVRYKIIEEIVDEFQLQKYIELYGKENIEICEELK